MHHNRDTNRLSYRHAYRQKQEAELEDLDKPDPRLKCPVCSERRQVQQHRRYIAELLIHLPHWKCFSRLVCKPAM